MVTQEEILGMVQAEDDAYEKEQEVIHEAVMALLDVIDEHYPDYKKSGGPFGDTLAYNLHKMLQGAFFDKAKLENDEREQWKTLNEKYGGRA